MPNNRLLLLARVCLAVVFLHSGVDKASNWSGAVAEAQALGLPWPALAMTATIAVQIVGGLCVLLGAFTRTGAIFLLAFTIAATLLAHWPLGLTGDEFRRQLTLSLEHLAIVGGFVALVATGPGAFSVDTRRGRHVSADSAHPLTRTN